MIGGGYYVLTHNWDWKWFGHPALALGVTTVIFGKHIDKIEADQAKNIQTLPVLVGEKFSRQMVIGMMSCRISFTLSGCNQIFTPLILIVLRAIRASARSCQLSSAQTGNPSEDFRTPGRLAPLLRTAGIRYNVRSYALRPGPDADVLIRIFLPTSALVI